MTDDSAGPRSALDAWDDLAERLASRRPAVFLDFDGTLSPIVERPEDAAILPAARRAVERLAEVAPVVVVSGRDRADVAERVGLDLVYAGSHGFDIAGPGVRHEVGGEIPALIERVSGELAAELARVPGAQVEPKRYTVAVHYRRVAEEDRGSVEVAIRRALEAQPELERAEGKRVAELRPRIEWDKGRALLHLLDALGLDGPDVVPVYVGDDVTDEDAFRALADRPGGGIGVRVADEPAETAAGWTLAGPDEVPELLDRLRAAAAAWGLTAPSP